MNEKKQTSLVKKLIKRLSSKLSPPEGFICVFVFFTPCYMTCGKKRNHSLGKYRDVTNNTLPVHKLDMKLGHHLVMQTDKA